MEPLQPDLPQILALSKQNSASATRKRHSRVLRALVLDEWADNSNERLARIQTKNCHGHRNRVLKIIARSSEGESRRLSIVRAEPLAHPKADQEHDEKVDDPPHSSCRPSMQFVEDPLPNATAVLDLAGGSAEMPYGCREQ
jgi:hypothetical protein